MEVVNEYFEVMSFQNCPLKNECWQDIADDLDSKGFDRSSHSMQQQVWDSFKISVDLLMKGDKLSAILWWSVIVCNDNSH